MEMDRKKSFRQAQLDLMKERREGHDAIDVFIFIFIFI